MKQEVSFSVTRHFHSKLFLSLVDLAVLTIFLIFLATEFASLIFPLMAVSRVLNDIVRSIDPKLFL
jgi:hypothetical protein